MDTPVVVGQSGAGPGGVLAAHLPPVTRWIGPEDPELTTVLSDAGAAISVVTDAEAVRRVIAAAVETGVRRLVQLSTAAVYGARATNPVPLTEDHPLQPWHAWQPAVEMAEIERSLATARRRHPSLATVTLRAVPGAHDPALVRPLRSRVAVRSTGPPRQFVHPHDVAGALLWALSAAPGGAFNLAPPGWLEARDVDRIIGRRRRLALPPGATGRLLRRLAQFGGQDFPPAALPYAEHPFVVDGRRLEAAGFRCTHGHEDALGAFFDGSPPRHIPPAVPVAAAAGLAGIGVAVWAWSRRRSGNS